jgi:hypothetical protein
MKSQFIWVAAFAIASITAACEGRSGSTSPTSPVNIQSHRCRVEVALGARITVTTGASTTFAGVACGSIKRNDRLGVVGTTQAGGAVAASCITGL